MKEEDRRGANKTEEDKTEGKRLEGESREKHRMPQNSKAIENRTKRKVFYII